MYNKPVNKSLHEFCLDICDETNIDTLEFVD